MAETQVFINRMPLARGGKVWSSQDDALGVLLLYIEQSVGSISQDLV